MIPESPLLRKLEPLVLPAIVVLVGLSSFGLGRLSVSENTAAASDTSEKKLVASVSGTKYYLPSCSGALQIKEENRIWFDAAAQAQAAGYEPAENCP